MVISTDVTCTHIKHVHTTKTHTHTEKHTQTHTEEAEKNKQSYDFSQSKPNLHFRTYTWHTGQFIQEASAHK